MEVSRSPEELHGGLANFTEGICKAFRDFMRALENFYMKGTSQSLCEGFVKHLGDLWGFANFYMKGLYEVPGNFMGALQSSFI